MSVLLNAHSLCLIGQECCSLVLLQSLTFLEIVMNASMADARLNFLNTSAHFYAITAPATAAHLLLHRAKVAEDNGLPYDKGLSSDTCRACGSIAVTDRQTEGLGVQDDEKAGISPLAGKTQDITCSVCRRVIRQSLTQKNQASRIDVSKRSGTAPSYRTSLGQPDTAAPQKSSLATQGSRTNSGAKQPSKARKRDSLQAIVERSKTSQSTGFASGPDLMDFMKAI